MRINATSTNFGSKKYMKTKSLKEIIKKTRPKEISPKLLENFRNKARKMMQEYKVKEAKSIESASKVILNA